MLCDSPVFLFSGPHQLLRQAENDCTGVRLQLDRRLAGERLVDVDAASRITLEAGYQARSLDWHGQLVSTQHPAYIDDPVAVHAPASSSCRVTLH